MNSKQKNILLVVGFFISLMICYQLSISNTLEAKKEYQKLREQEAFFKDTPKQLSLLKQKEHYYDSILTKYQLNESSIQNNLLTHLNAFSKKQELRIIDFKEPHIYKNNTFLSKDYQFVVQGDYYPMVSFAYQLEQKTKFGEIVNFHFEKKKNYRTGKYYLQASVLLRNYSQL